MGPKRESKKIKTTLEKIARTSEDICLKSRKEIEERLDEVDRLEIICCFSLVTQIHFKNEENLEPKLNTLMETPSSQYLIGLALKKPNIVTQKAEIYQINHLMELIYTYFKNFQFSIFPSTFNLNSKEGIVFSARSQHLISQNNHERYPFQTIDLLHGIFNSIDDYFLISWGFNVDDSIDFSQKIADFYTKKLKQKITHARKCEENIRDKVLFSNIKELFRITPDIFCELMKISNVDRFKNYLTALSCEFGDQYQNFECPLDKNIIFEKPIIKSENSFFAPLPSELLQNLPAILESLLVDEKQKNSRIWKKYLKQKSEYTEERTTEYLQRLFKTSDVHKNLFYNLEQQLCEVDNIIPFSNNVIIVETKSGIFSDSAKRGGIRRIETDIRRLISEAFDQGLRVKKYISNNPLAKFFDSKGIEKLIIKSDTTTNFIFINVTLEPLVNFSSRLKQFEKLGIFTNNEYPWSINLFDLDIITRHLESPAIFIHYIESRIKLQSKDFIFSPDELTYFGFYLQFGNFNIQSYNGKKVSGLLLEPSFLEKFDRHYMFQEESPRLEIEPEILKIVKDVELLSIDNFTKLTNAILDLDHPSRKEVIHQMKERINATKKDGNRHDFTLFGSKEGITIITQRAREELSIILENYCSLKKYQCKANKWIGFGIDILNTDFLVSDFFLDESKWERDPILDKALKWAIKQKMIGLSPKFKKID